MLYYHSLWKDFDHNQSNYSSLYIILNAM